MDLTQSFGLVFKRLRLARGLSQEFFSPVVTDRYLRKLEKGGASPTLDTLARLAELLEIHPSTLIALCEADRISDTDLESLLASINEEIRIARGLNARP